MPDCVAQVPAVPVGVILPPGLTGILQRGLQLRPGHAQQRTQNPHAVHHSVLRHGRQPCEPRAPHQVQKQRFRLIVPVMGQGQGLRPGLRHGLPEEAVPRPSRPVLPWMLRRLRPVAQKRYVSLTAQRPDKGLVPVRRCAPQAVVHMHRRHPAAPCQQHQHQGHGIRPAADPRQHMAGHGRHSRRKLPQAVHGPPSFHRIKHEGGSPHRRASLYRQPVAYWRSGAPQTLQATRSLYSASLS